MVLEISFNWNKYLTITNAKEVPKDYFHHVSSNLQYVRIGRYLSYIFCNQIQFCLQICNSEMNGIELGSVVEIEYEDKSGYWFASVCFSKGVLIKYVINLYFNNIYR